MCVVYVCVCFACVCVFGVVYMHVHVFMSSVVVYRCVGPGPCGFGCVRFYVPVYVHICVQMCLVSRIYCGEVGGYVRLCAYTYTLKLFCSYFKMTVDSHKRKDLMPKC